MSEPSSLVTSESRTSHLLRTGAAMPRFLQGIFPFAGRGMFDPVPVDDSLSYTVPAGKSAELVFFRAGNLSDDLLYLSVTLNGNPLRYFPVGSKGDVHVALAIVEPHPAGACLGVCVGAPRGLTGTLVLDVGILEIAEGS
jgi:assimilatory nitrate reductase catalytic subunit